MLKSCSICSHERRSEVDAALLKGDLYTEVAKRFGTSMISVLNHRTHLSGNGADTAHPVEPPKPGALVERIKALQQKCLLLMEVAQGASEVRTVFSSLAEMRQHLLALGDAAEELHRLSA